MALTTFDPEKLSFRQSLPRQSRASCDESCSRPRPPEAAFAHPQDRRPTQFRFLREFHWPDAICLHPPTEGRVELRSHYRPEKMETSG
jgi:hypothetical protein